MDKANKDKNKVQKALGTVPDQNSANIYAAPNQATQTPAQKAAKAAALRASGYQPPGHPQQHMHQHPHHGSVTLPLTDVGGMKAPDGHSSMPGVLQQQGVTATGSNKRSTKKTDKKKQSPASPVYTSSGGVELGAGQSQANNNNSGIMNNQPPSPPKEYNELMELIDHSVDYDFTTAGTLLANEYMKDIDLDEEQRLLLYGNRSGPPNRNQQQQQLYPNTVVSSPPLGPSRIMGSSTRQAYRHDKTPSHAKPVGHARPGWGKTNIVTPHIAWARVQLAQTTSNTSFSFPTTAVTPAHMSDNITTKTPTLKWTNEDIAEKDTVLNFLSEATEIYIKTLLEGTIRASRQRQNLDGVRIWHRQHASSTGSNNKNDKSGTLAPPPLFLRLGCDVRRQHALAVGNAAKICQRMEEALMRKKPELPLVISAVITAPVPSSNQGAKGGDNDGGDSQNGARGVLNHETAFHATSMADLSKCVRIENAASRADLDAKRNFEIYGGKHSGAPPFGRVPKRPRLTATDLRNFLEQDPLFPYPRRGIRKVM